MPQSQTSTEKANNLLALISGGLHVHAEQATARTLGDRSKYVGLSDIGRALECPRAALANKIFARPQADLKKQLTMQRGHWLEYGIGQALHAQGLRVMPQLELALVHNGVPIRAHLDFTLVWDKPRPAIRILELKSTGHLPDTLFASYELQQYGQSGLLHKLWNRKAFTLRDEFGAILHHNLSMPQLCRAHFGLSMPMEPDKVDIEAWVLCISMDNAKPFGPYVPEASMLDLCLKTAESIWENKQAVESGRLDLDTLAHAKGFHPLCAYCDWNADCPKFHDDEQQPEWACDLARLDKLKSAKSDLDAEITEMEGGLKDAYNLSGISGWINTGEHRFRVSSQPGRRTLNRDLLLAELAAVMDIAEAESLISRCEREGEAFQRLMVSKINKKGVRNGI